MPALGSVVLGAIAVFLLVLVSLVLQGKRQARARKSQRSDLGLVRVAILDPVLTAGILSAFSSGPADGDYMLAGLERVTIDQPGTWYVAMVKHRSAAGQAPPTSTHVLLVIEGLPRPGQAVEPMIIAGTDDLWTQRWVSGLLLVESAPDGGDAARDFERMTGAGARAVAAASAQ